MKTNSALPKGMSQEDGTRDLSIETLPLAFVGTLGIGGPLGYAAIEVATTEGPRRYRGIEEGTTPSPVAGLTGIDASYW